MSAQTGSSSSPPTVQSPNVSHDTKYRSAVGRVSHVLEQQVRQQQEEIRRLRNENAQFAKLRRLVLS